MDQEIEKLIKYAVADGEITEKGRAVIMRKAESLGEDLDDVEMILNGELALVKKQPLHPKSNKQGDLKKCPSCGAPVPSLSLMCLECGHEFRNTEATLSLNEFFSQVKSAKPDDRAMIIANFPIPNNKEDLIEFITLSVGNCRELTKEEREAYVLNAFKGTYKPELYAKENEIKSWQGKAETAIMKANVLFSDNPMMLDRIKRFNDQFFSNKNHRQQLEKKKLTFLILFGIVMVGLMVLMLLIQ